MYVLHTWFLIWESLKTLDADLNRDMHMGQSQIHET